MSPLAARTSPRACEALAGRRAAAIVFLTTASSCFASPTADALFVVVKSGTAQDVRREIAGEADVNAGDEDGWTPLMAAAGYNARPEVIQLLLKAGADVNAGDRTSMTALSWAAMRSSNPQVFRVILEAGADAESRDVFLRLVGTKTSCKCLALFAKPCID